MNRVIAFVCVSLAAASLVFAASEKKKKSAMSGGADEQAIRQIEDRWAAALVKADTATMDQFTTPDWMLTTATGQLLTRDEANADLKSGDIKFQSVQLRDLKIKIHGDTAVAFGLTTDKSTHKGKDIGGEYRFTDTFVKRDGTWKCVATHASKVMKE